MFFFLFFLVEMLLGVLGCIGFIMSLIKSLIWHVLIGWCKPKGLHPILMELKIASAQLHINPNCLNDTCIFVGDNSGIWLYI